MEIARQLPIPENKGRGSSMLGRRVRELQVGDAMIKLDEREMESVRHIMRYLGWKACVRKDEKGWSVWRT